MGAVRVNRHTYLYFDFRFNGLRYREGAGLRDTKENRAKCEKYMRLVDAEIEAGIFDYKARFPHGNRLSRFATPGGKDGPTFREYADSWLAENAPPHGLKHSTYQDYRSTLNFHAFPAFGDTSLNSIDTHTLKMFRQGLKVSPKRVNNIFVPLKTIFKEAERAGVLGKDPTAHIRPLRVGKTDIHPLSLREINTLLPVFPAFWRAFFTVAFYTGMRTGELIALRWRYIDLGAGSLRVRKSITRGVEGLPKTERSQRDVLMLPPVLDALTGHMAAYCLSGKPSAYIFPNQAGKPLDADHIRERVWLPALKKAGLDRRTLYQTRHTYASLMLAAGEDRLWVADQMGTSLEMLSKTYARHIKNPTRADGSAFLQMYTATVAR